MRLLFLIPLAALLAARAAAMPGDLDGDGRVTVADATLALHVAVGRATLPPGFDLAAGDLAPRHPDGSFGDGKITPADAIAILRLALGLDAAALYAAPSAPQRLALLEGGALTATAAPDATGAITLTAEIHGSLPDPSWRWERTDIAINGDTITLTPILVRASRGPAAAVLAPFHATVVVPGLPPGHAYTVIATGADARLATTVDT